MTKVTIAFNVPDHMYGDYEDIIQTLSDDLNCIGIDDMEVTEEQCY